MKKNAPGILDDNFLLEKLTKLVDLLEKRNEFFNRNIKLLTGQVLTTLLFLYYTRLLYFSREIKF